MLDWLAGREPPMPDVLGRAVRKAVTDAEAAGAVTPGAALADRLAEAGLHALSDVIRANADRAAAAELLAADALLTYACEAAAEAGETDVERITTRFGDAQIARLLESASP